MSQIIDVASPIAVGIIYRTPSPQRNRVATEIDCGPASVDSLDTRPSRSLTTPIDDPVLPEADDHQREVAPSFFPDDETIGQDIVSLITMLEEGPVDAEAISYSVPTEDEITDDVHTSSVQNTSQSVPCTPCPSDDGSDTDLLETEVLEEPPSPTPPEAIATFAKTVPAKPLPVSPATTPYTDITPEEESHEVQLALIQTENVSVGLVSSVLQEEYATDAFSEQSRPEQLEELSPGAQEDVASCATDQPITAASSPLPVTAPSPLFGETDESSSPSVDGSSASEKTLSATSTLDTLDSTLSDCTNSSRNDTLHTQTLPLAISPNEGASVIAQTKTSLKFKQEAIEPVLSGMMHTCSTVIVIDP